MTRAQHTVGPNSTKDVWEVARRYADTVTAYPDGSFRTADLPEYLIKRIRQLRAAGVIEQVDSYEDRVGKSINIYSVVDDAREIAARQQSHRTTICPCDHGGFENHGQFYTCAFELCPNTYARDDLEVRD